MNEVIEVERGNAVIGAFMGKNFKDPLNYMYDKDWNELIKACKKFDTIVISERAKKRRSKYEEICDEIDNAVTCYEILPAFEELVKGINWYNQWYNQNKDK